LDSSFIFQALIVGSVFVNSPDATSAFFARGGVLFLYAHLFPPYRDFLLTTIISSLLFTALTAMAEISALFGQRAIVNRHKNAALYHPFVEALALTLVDVPITAVTTVLYGVVVYFMVGLQRSAVRSLRATIYSFH
jgi:ATP-binding cassette subfamily G (WHITE) protein 2 (SNQ2)